MTTHDCDVNRGGHDPLAKSMSTFLHLDSASTTTSDLKEALAEILERFQTDQRYRNDERYLKLWMRYADLSDDGDKVFLLLKSAGIGTQLSLFWAAWAYVLEMTEAYERVALTIAEGRAWGAQPVSLLEDFLRSFHERMLKRMRMVGLDARIGEVKEEIDFASTRSREQAMLRAKQSQTAAHAQREHAPDQPNISQHEPIEGINKLCTGGGGPYGSRCRPVDAPLGARDVNSRDGAALRRKECSTRNRPNRLPRPRVETDKTATIATTTAALVRNPFSPDMRRRLTTNTAQYLCWASSSSIVYDTRLDSLAKACPRRMAKVNVGSRRPVALARSLGNQRINVLGVLGEGAFAVVFSCKFSKDQRDVAVKVEYKEDAPSLPWECFITLQLSERLLHRRQRKICSVTEAPITVVKPEALFLYRDGCAMAMPVGLAGTLHDLVALYSKRAQAVPQLVAMHYAVEMLRFCRAMHSASILHMDIKPDNWLLVRRPRSEVDRTKEMEHAGGQDHSMSLIDFGRAIDLSVFPQNGSDMAFTGQCCAPSFSCPAMREGLAWKHDADLYALGSCMYFMLHGVYLEVSREREDDSILNRSGRWRPVQNCKRYWEVDLWDTIFSELLNSDYRTTDTAGTNETLLRLEESLTSYLNVDHRSRDLKDCLRRQDNMIFNR
ncbi:unnamed protein product [Ectocarpus sp. 12 AP-2014]